jgi:hypothetical protein
MVGLSSAARCMVDTAAVSLDDPMADELAWACPLSPDVFDAALAEAVGGGVLVRWARTVSFRHALLREAAVSRLMPQGRRASRGARGADVCVPRAPSDAAPSGRPVGSGAGGAGTHGHRPLGSARRRNRAAHLTLGRIEESQRLSTRPGRCCPRTRHPCGRRCSTCCGTGRAGWRRPPHHGGDPLRGSTGTSRTTRSPSTTCWRPATPTPRRRATAATSPGSAGRWRQR